MYRKLSLSPRAGGVAGPAVAIAIFEKTAQLPKGYAALDQASGGVITAALGRSEFSAARGAVTTLYPAGKSRRIYVLGLGPRAKFSAETVRIAAAKALRAAFAAKLTRLTLDLLPGLEGQLNSNHAGRAVGDGLAIANFEFDAFKGQAGKNGEQKPGPAAAKLDLTIELATATAPGPAPDSRALRDGIQHGLKLGESVNLTRELAATPPNVANPRYLAGRAQRMARETGLRCKLIDARAAARLGMGGLLAVGGAGSQPPVLICLEHKPARAKGQPILLVGKAVTFDTGGYSIKPADSMDRMKYDKCGGMAVLGAMHAIARLKLPLHVVGLIPTAENLISERAYRPGDIVRFYNGVTSEVTNTDAEGRMILADALAYGTKTYKPQAVIDMATLTGGVVVALGSACAGAFCADAGLRGHLFDAADHTGERLWHLPLWDEHRALMKGTHGDLVNAGPRGEASSSQGAAFLSYFIEPDGKTKLPELPWCHLDIAGVADVKSNTDLFAKGPTAFGLRLVVRALETWGERKK